MTSKAKTVAQFLKELPDDRREVVEAIRSTILKNLDKGFQESVQYGMIGYGVPHSSYPAGYHCDPKQPLPFAGISNQKNHIGIYLFCIYTDEKVHKTFVDDWKKTGKRLDMGKSCVRVKKLDDVALDVLGKTIKKVTVREFISAYEDGLKQAKSRKKP